MPTQFNGRTFFTGNEATDILGFPVGSVEELQKERAFYFRGMAELNPARDARLSHTVFAEGYFFSDDASFVARAIEQAPEKGQSNPISFSSPITLFPCCAIVDGSHIKEDIFLDAYGNDHWISVRTIFGPIHYAEDTINGFAESNGITAPQPASAKDLLANLESDAQANRTSPKSEKSLLTIVIALAVKGYGYDPTARKSPIPAEIAQDIEKLGLSLDVDTIRGWLRRGAELLPQKPRSVPTKPRSAKK